MIMQSYRPSGRKIKDELGRKYGLVTVIKFLDTGPQRDGAWWLCKCTCGKEWPVRGGALKKMTGCQSCGLKLVKSNDYTRYKKERDSWRNMVKRCTRPTDKAWKWYGGRGISVCNEWLNNFKAFIDDLGGMPADGYTLERVDVNGNYCKENCKWIPKKDQGVNKRNTRILVFKGKAKTIKEWAKELGVSSSTLGTRINCGWTVEDTLRQQLHTNRVPSN